MKKKHKNQRPSFIKDATIKVKHSQFSIKLIEALNKEKYIKLEFLQ